MFWPILAASTVGIGLIKLGALSVAGVFIYGANYER